VATNTKKTLLDRTRVELQRCTLTLLDIHRLTGLSYHWLTKLSAGNIHDPSVNKIQKLYEFLTGEHI